MNNNVAFNEVTKRNVKTAVKIQNSIFPYESGESDILESVGKLYKNYAYVKYYLIKLNNKVVGITGYYSYDLYPSDAWLGWFGVLESKNHDEICNISMQFIKDRVTERGYKTLRVFSDEICDADVNRVYKKFNMTREEYKIEKNKYYSIGKTYIYSISLTQDKTKKWNNKCLFLEYHEQRNVNIKENIQKQLNIDITKIKYVSTTKLNVKQAIKIQQAIFPLESGRNDILESLEKEKKNYQELKYWIIQYEEKYIGITGLYSYKKYPKDAWIAWFGLLPQYRKQGIGKYTIEMLKQKAKDLGFENLHVYTDSVLNNYACYLYDKAFETKEIYLNEKNKYYSVGDTLIYSINLYNEPSELWKDKCINLELHEKNNNVCYLKYVPINIDNIKIAGLVQYEIFNDSNSCGYCDYLEELKLRNENNPLPLDFLVYYKNKPAGVIGLYNIEGYPDDIWLNWFGVREKYRNRGFGTQMLLFSLETAKKYGKKYFRLFTYSAWQAKAQLIYQRTMKLEEKYTNKNDDIYCIENGKPKIFSINLTGKKIKKWNNKFINLSSEKLLHMNSVKQMQKDGLFDFEKKHKNLL